MDGVNTENRLILIRYFSTIFVIVAAVVMGAVTGFYYYEKGDYQSRLKLEERVNVKLEAALIERNLGEIFSDLGFLSEQNEMIQMLDQDHGGEAYKALMAREYGEFSRKKQKYDQIRFIDVTGMEKVRVDFKGGDPAIVPERGLQNKGNRYYFKDTLALLRGEIFISPFDLNIEHGKIEEPLKPMIRLGTPVFDKENQKRGVVILNYLGDRLLKTLKESSEMSPGNLMLVNSDGYWLYSPDAGDEWGFMFPEKSDRKFSTDFPDVWKRILTSRVTQVKNERGLFTSATVYPVMEGSKTSSGSVHARGNSHKRLKADEYFWKVVSYLPNETLQAGTKRLQTKILFLNLVLLLLVCISSWIIARDMVRRKSYQMALYRSANFDKLTDIPNRALFLDRLDQNLKQSERYKRKCSLLFIDLDGFKSVNDTLGHGAGDALLIQTARRIQDCVRDADTVARIGGDEFTVILSTIRSVDDVRTVAQKIIKSLAMPFKIRKHEAQIGASIGISVYPVDGTEAEILLKKADDAMYQAKNGGKNGYRLSS
jgi:diguanylate cyclase (GGDEF)-like protein